MNRYVRSSSPRSRSNRFSTCAWIDTSSAATASSDDDGGLERQRARDANALALAARELVRITLRIAWVQPDLAHQPGHVIGLVARGHQLRHRRLADDLAHARGFNEA